MPQNQKTLEIKTIGIWLMVLYVIVVSLQSGTLLRKTNHLNSKVSNCERNYYQGMENHLKHDLVIDSVKGICTQFYKLCFKVYYVKFHD